MQILKFARFQQESVPGQRALLTMKFLDDDSNLYSWAPRWGDLENAFLRALNIEGFNKPESEWLNRFASTVKEVAEGVSQPIGEARKTSGLLTEVRNGKLRLSRDDEWGNWSEDFLTPGFAITYEFLNDWLDNWVEALVINGVAVRLRATSGAHKGQEYPSSPVEVSPVEAPGDLPW